ncbi:MAG TPA: phosphatase PAP2 family protein [Longimicrobiales bacterium]
MSRLLAAYLLLSGLALAGPHRPGTWPLLALAHVALAAVALRAADSARDGGVVRAWLVALLPLLVMPLLYAELPLLNQAVWGGRYFDETIITAERALFGFEPARELARMRDEAWISEPLHAAYISYYLIIYAPPLLIGWKRGTAAMREAVFTLALVFFAHYLFFVWFPVEGPRYRFETPVTEDARGAAYQLAHALLEAGSSRGAAFPSSHVGVSVAATIVTWRHLRALAPLIGVLTVGLAFGAVYGGFHYGIDALAGALLGGALATLAPRLRSMLEAGRA